MTDFCSKSVFSGLTIWVVIVYTVALLNHEICRVDLIEENSFSTKQLKLFYVFFYYILTFLLYSNLSLLFSLLRTFTG